MAKYFKTCVEIDQEAYALAKQVIGTTTLKDTVNEALREVARRGASAEFMRLAEAGLFGQPAHGAGE